MTQLELMKMIELQERIADIDALLSETSYRPVFGRNYFGQQDPTASKAMELSDVLDARSRYKSQLSQLSERLDRLLSRQSDAFAAAVVRAEYIDGFKAGEVLQVAIKRTPDIVSRRDRVLENILKAEEIP